MIVQFETDRGAVGSAVDQPDLRRAQEPPVARDRRRRGGARVQPGGAGDAVGRPARARDAAQARPRRRCSAAGRAPGDAPRRPPAGVRRLLRRVRGRHVRGERSRARRPTGYRSSRTACAPRESPRAVLASARTESWVDVPDAAAPDRGEVDADVTKKTPERRGQTLLQMQGITQELRRRRGAARGGPRPARRRGPRDRRRERRRQVDADEDAGRRARADEGTIRIDGEEVALRASRAGAGRRHRDRLSGVQPAAGPQRRRERLRRPRAGQDAASSTARRWSARRPRCSRRSARRASARARRCAGCRSPSSRWSRSSRRAR